MLLSRSPMWAKALVVSLILISTNGFASTEQERQARLKALKETIEQVKKELDNVNTNRTDILDSLEETESKIGELNKKMEDLTKDLEDKQTQLIQLKKDKGALTLAKKQQTQSASAQLNTAYRLGRQSGLKLILNQKSPSNIARNVKYWETLVKARNKKIQTFAHTLKKLGQIEPQIARDAAAVARKQKHIAAQQSALKKAQGQRKQTLVILNTQRQQKGAKLESLNIDQQQLQSLVAQVQTAAVHLPAVPSSKLPFKKLKGKLPWPTPGKLLHTYGSARVKGKVRWQGMLIGANEGAPVRAIHGGRVVFSDYLRGHGLLIIIDHGAGFMSLYAHNQSLYTQLGDWVEGGTHIASVGVSGGKKTASLYFELRYKGQPTNPHRWLKRA